jgi:disulfide bond formation protein DsbB
LFKGFGIGLLAGGLGIAGLGGIIALIGTGLSAGVSGVCRDFNFSGRAQCDSSPTGLYIATGTMAGIGGAFVLAGAVLLAVRPSGSGSVSAIPVVPARTPTWSTRWATPSASSLPIVSATF